MKHFGLSKCLMSLRGSGPAGSEPFFFGLAAMGTQIIFLRKFLTLFYGNELSAGITLSFWLLITALGASAGKRFFSPAQPEREILKIIFAFAVFLPVTFIAADFFGSAGGAATGKILSPFFMIPAVFFLLFPCCFLAGALFPLFCAFRTGEKHVSAGIVYALDAAGTAFGGIAASFLLVRFFSPLQSAWLISGLIFFLLGIKVFSCGGKSSIYKFSKIMFAVFATAYMMDVPSSIEDFFLKKRYAAHNVIISADSIYGNITLIERQGQLSFIKDGSYDFSFPGGNEDCYAAYVPLLQAPNAAKALFIGGGPGAARWAQRFPLKEIIYAQQDTKLMELYERWASSGVFGGRLRLAEGDPRELVKKSASEYDCVVVNGSLPLNARDNRFYTVEFFARAKIALKEGGILSLSAESASDYLSPSQAAALSSVYKSLSAVFKNVLAIPGEKTLFLASDGDIDMNYEKLLQNAGMEDDAVAGVIVLNTRSSRLKWMKDAISSSAVGENRDLRPLAYYYGFFGWLETFGHLFGKTFLPNGDITGTVFLFALVFITAVAVLSGRKTGAVLFATAATGFSALFFQILMMIVFQIIYGQLYYRIGLISTFFMAGMASGSFAGSRKNISCGKAFSALLKVQAIYIFFPLLFVFYIPRLFEGTDFFTGSSGLFFMLIPFIYAFPAGLRFSLSARLEGGKNFSGRLYAADFAGSALGAALGAAVLIPVLGIYKSCLLAAALNLIALMRLFSYNQEGG